MSLATRDPATRDHHSLDPLDALDYLLTMPILTLAGRIAGLALALAVCAESSHAQQRRYLVELGGGGAYTTFDDATNLEGGMGGVGRLGVWLPYRLSVEGEIQFSSPSSTGGPGWSATTMSASVLGNIAIGRTSSAFVRLGYGSTTYDNNLCPGSTVFGPCGSAGGLVGGVGGRVGITPTVMLRFDAGGTFARVRVATTRESVTNIGASLGLALMLASKPLTDLDRDGVYDSDDDCDDTPLGALTDRRGCPTDSDGDAVADGIDRCPSTPRGAAVNAAGCPRDEDADNVPDGIDKCPATPAGATAGATGCPQDEDEDRVPDGLDRCPTTPKGASVDQLGCPGDEDSDRVLDGLDRCPRTPAGTAVNTFGCPPGAPGQGGTGTLGAGTRRTLAGVTFTRGSARLPAAANPSLDSLARELRTASTLQFEIAAHGDGSAAETRYLTQLRAEAVRTYLVQRGGVPVQRITARGYGAAERISTDTTTAARDANRRIELRVLAAPAGR
jgi:outer membrane protein OmpA-like peptidoglycan-associated protein